MTQITVIIPTYYRYDCLQKLLNQLSNQTISPFEVIVADQTPVADRAEKFYESFNNLNLTVLDLDQPSLTKSRNQAVSIVKSEWVLFLDDDVEISNEHIEKFTEYTKSGYMDVVVGGVSNEKELPKKWPWKTEDVDPVMIFLKCPCYNWNGMSVNMPGGHTLIRKSCFDDVGGFDEKIPRMEDVEMGYRLFRSGVNMFYRAEPFAHHSSHKKGGTRKSQKDIKFEKLVSKLYLHMKHFPGWGTKQLVLKEIYDILKIKAYYLKPWNFFRRFNRLWKAYDQSRKLIGLKE